MMSVGSVRMDTVFNPLEGSGNRTQQLINPT